MTNFKNLFHLRLRDAPLIFFYLYRNEIKKKKKSSLKLIIFQWETPDWNKLKGFYCGYIGSTDGRNIHTDAVFRVSFGRKTIKTDDGIYIGILVSQGASLWISQETEDCLTWAWLGWDGWPGLCWVLLVGQVAELVGYWWVGSTIPPCLWLWWLARLVLGASNLSF